MKKYSPSQLRQCTIFLLAVFFLSAALAHADLLEIDEKSKENTRANPYLIYKEKHRIDSKELENCSWLVTYRRRIYDLSPLTRKSLDRHLEGDIQSVLRRVPAAEAHLEKIERNNRDSKVHTAIASLAIASFLITRIAQGSDVKKSKSPEYLALNVGSLLLFLRAAYAGWEVKQDSKAELVQSIQEFNKVSEDQIQPYEGGS